MSNYSENEDDPEVFQSSGDEWDSEAEKGKKNNKRGSTRLTKKQIKGMAETESTDEESEGEPKKKKSKNGANKKKKGGDKDYKEESDEKDDSAEESSNSNTSGKGRKFLQKTIYSENYSAGSFVISKKDAKVEAAKHPCIWRIDGKALLQKFEAFDEDGKVLHKNTSIYTGWSPMDKDIYAPVTVDVIRHGNHNLVVELRWDDLKNIETDDSEGIEDEEEVDEEEDEGEEEEGEDDE